MSTAENSTTSGAEQFVLSHHDIFWVKRNGVRVLVCHAGDLLQHAKLARFPAVDFELRVDKAKIEKISTVLLELKSAMRPKMKMKTVARVRSDWHEWFHSAEGCSVLELVVLSEVLFSEQMRTHAATWSQASLPLFHRSCFVATMSALGACALGYASWAYLEGIWQVSFAHSVELAQKGITLSTLEELEGVRSRGGEKAFALTHVETNYPSLVDVAKIVFERANGNGGPRGLHLAEMTDIERWYAHLQINTPWEQDFINSEDKWFKNFWSIDEFHILEKLIDRRPRDQQGHHNEEYLDFDL